MDQSARPNAASDISGPVMVAEPVLQLFGSLNRKGILWCSWKSNEHLEAGLTGKTDLDLLLDPSRKTEIMGVLKECGYTFFYTPPHRSYPDIIDAFAIDPETGVLLHAHCHFSLVIGEKHLKSFTLPWAHTLLLHRHEQMNVQGVSIYATSPMDEMIILLMREALKFRWRDVIRFHMGKPWSDPGMKIEFSWLEDRVDYDEFRARSIGLTSSFCSSQMTSILYKDLTLTELLRLREIVQALAAEKKWRRMSALAAMIRAKWNESVFALTLFQSRFDINWPAIPRRRTLAGNGLIIAVTGIDGSGKSTIVREIAETWQRKIDINRVYFGTGDGQKTLLQRALMLLRTLLKNSNAPSKGLQKQGDSFTIGDSWPAIAWALAAALQKKSAMRRALKLRAGGMLVICDRWPQNEMPGLNDGPLLSHLKTASGLKRRAADWESRAFEKITAAGPDILIRLSLPIETARSRKNDAAQQGLVEIKARQMEQLTFKNAKRVETVNADRDLNSVILSCKHIIWSQLSRRSPAPFLIESLGLPGAGKTTLAKKLLGEIPASGIEVLTSSWAEMPMRGRLAIGIRGLSDIRLWFIMLKFLFSTGLWHNRYAATLFLKMPFQRQLALTLLKHQNLLLDQWMIQNMWSAMVTAEKIDIPVKKLAPLIRALYRDIPVTFMSHAITPHEAATRIASRTDGKSRFDGQSAKSIEPELENSQAAIKKLYESCILADKPTLMIHKDYNYEFILNAIIQGLR